MPSGGSAASTFTLTAVAAGKHRLKIKAPASQPDEVGVSKVVGVQPPGIDEFDSYKLSATQWRNVPWGPESWVEPGGLGTLYQRLDLDLPAGTAPAGGWPLVIWFHANGSTKTVPGSGALFNAKASAMAAGFAFAAVEFRHPVVNVGEGAPHTDTGLAIQYLRAMATAMQLDKTQFFGLAKSRGSLCLWQSLQADMANSTADTWEGRQSSLLKGIWTHAAQSTYSTTEFANRFILAGERAAFLVANPDDVRWGSALQSIPTAPQPPYVTILHADAHPTGLVHANEVDEHYSGFGSAFRDDYTANGLGALVTADDLISDANAYIGATAWFTSLL
jgi:hypothetical protein